MKLRLSAHCRPFGIRATVGFRAAPAVLIVMVAVSAPAATTQWNNPSSGYWTNAANWSAGVPGAGDTARWLSANSQRYTNYITVTGTQSVHTLDMDWAANACIDQYTYVYLNTGSVTMGIVTCTNLQLAYGNPDASSSYQALTDYLIGSNVALAVGSPSARGVIRIGQKTGGENKGTYGYFYGYGNSILSAYVSSLKVGYGGHSGGSANGGLYSYGASSFLDVSGNVELGSSSSGEAYYRNGSLTLYNGTGTVGSLYLGYTTASETQTGVSPNMYGFLTLSNATFRVSGSGRVYLGGRGQNANETWQINRASAAIIANSTVGGLDIQNSASDGLTLKFPTLLNDDGAKHYLYNQIKVTLTEPSTSGWSWGLRWAGNHTNSNTQSFTGGGAQGLRALLDSANAYSRLYIVTNGLSAAALTNHLLYLQCFEPAKYAGKTIADLTYSDFVVYDPYSDYTYVGMSVPPATPTPLVNNAGGATNVTGTTATLCGTLLYTGLTETAVFVFWGPTDGGTNVGAWACSNAFGVNSAPLPASYSTNVGGLADHTTYYYRFYATNSAGARWAYSSSSFYNACDFVLNSNQTLTAGTAITGTLRGTNATWSKSESPSGYYLSSVSGATGLDFSSRSLTTTDGTSLLFDLNGMPIRGAGATAIATWSSSGSSGTIEIRTTNDVDCGGLSTTPATGGGNAMGNILIGSTGSRAGNVRVGFLHAYLNGYSVNAGTISVYGRGHVRIGNAGGTPGDILTWTLRNNYEGVPDTAGGVTVVHDGEFLARNIYTYHTSDNFSKGGHVTLNGDGAGDGASGACSVSDIFTYSLCGPPYGERGGNVTITGYSSVRIGNVDTRSGDDNAWAGTVTITNITGAIDITGSVDLRNTDSSTRSGRLILAAGGRITLANLDLGRVYSATLSAADTAHVTGALVGFVTNTPASGLLDATANRGISYDNTLATNSYLNAQTYTLKSGGLLFPLQGQPPVIGNLAASNLTGTSATLWAHLFSTGSSPTRVCVYWGTNSASWENTNDLGVCAEGFVSQALTGLSQETTYYYRFYATNSAAGVWAPTTNSFRTLVDTRRYAYKMKIAFSGYDRSETLVNFPALVVFTNNLNGFLYSQFHSTNGWDLRFQDSSETQVLNYEIESWTTNGNSYVWVQVPVLTNNAFIWAYWGNPAQASAPAAYTTNGATWSQNYVIVAHLAETSGSTIRDSTANRNNGSIGNNPVLDAAGVVNGGDSFPGTDEYIAFGTTARPNNNFTFSAWIKTSETHQVDTESNSGTDGVNGQRYGIWPSNGGSDAGSGLSAGTDGLSVYEHGSSYMPPLAVWSGSNGADWNHIQVVYNNRRPSIYRNAILVRTGLTSGRGTVYAPYRIGDGDYGEFNGSLDEFRVSSVIRSADWIWAEFMNMASNTVFNTYGPTTCRASPTVFVFR